MQTVQFRSWFERARSELAPLAVLGLLAFLAAAFMEVADDVAEGDTHGFDRYVLYALRTPEDAGVPLGPQWLRIAAADITALGSVTDLSLIVLVVAGVFFALGRWRTALVMLAAPLSGVAVSQALKLLYGRERPPLDLHAVEVVNASFPSGHAMLSATVYLTLAALVARLVRRRRIKLLALSAGVTVTLLVGCSRVYLGVHWPTDVLAGWCIGSAWAAAWWLAAYLMERRWPELHEETVRGTDDAD